MATADTRSLRGRPINEINYKKLADMDVESQKGMNEERRSIKSTRSKKSVSSKKSLKSNKSSKNKVKKGKGDNEEATAPGAHSQAAEGTTTDSREGDFSTESEEEALSMGSAAGRLQQLQKGIDDLDIPLVTKYNERLIAEGKQVRLEDAPLPEKLEVDETYQVVVNEHKQQLEATKNRSIRAARRLEMIQMRNNIIEEKIAAEKMELECKLMEQQAVVNNNRYAIERKRAKLQMNSLKEEEAKQNMEMAQLNEETSINKRGKPAKKVQTKKTVAINLVSDNASDCNQAPPTGVITASAIMQDNVSMSKQSSDRVADWVSKQSGSGLAPMTTEEDEVRTRAMRIIGEKKRRRTTRLQKSRTTEGGEAGPHDVTHHQTAEASASSCPYRGTAHLKKLELVPNKFGSSQEDTDEEMDQKRKSKSASYPLGYNTNFNREMQVKNSIDINCNECACLGAKPKLKSGKYVKANINIKRQETWPHTAVSKKYAKRTSYDNLELDAFIAGEAKTIYMDMSVAQRNADALGVNRALGRLRVLILIAHWHCKTKNWPSIRSVFESIIEEVELGEREWTDDYSSYETVLSSAMNPANNAVLMAEKAPKRALDVYWCKPYQSSQCDLPSPHMASLKPDEPQVPVVHICATCWQNLKKRREHREQDCPSKK